ncbi:glycosyltransferase family 39 protein [uncultured Clostridium sp.]|uniref:glycosyltransferase family 39 protein n=1 Tax=uncultured Clostridium sp. TaxID=59620 RepID=UPI002592AA61|nr:glycosyltransferase family 39 protein [uncultured Clostridium sp.]
MLNSMAKFFWKFLRYLGLFIVSLILINAIFIPGIIKNDQSFLLSNMTIIAISIIIILFLPCYTFIVKKHRKKLYTVLFLMQLVIQIYLIFKMQGMHVVDDIYMYLQAGRLVDNFNSPWETYFSFAANNIIATIVYAGIMKLSLFLHISIVLSINIFSFICVDIAIICGYFILQSVFHDQRALDIYILFVNIFFPIYVVALIMYTDVLSLMLMMLGILIFIKFLHAKKVYLRIIYIILSAIFLMFATSVKTNTAIATIAILIYMILNRTNWRYFLTFSTICILLFGLSAKIVNSHVNERYSFPYSYWIGEGFNSDTDGTFGKVVNGKYIDTWAITNQYTTKKDKDNYNKNYIKESIKKLGPLGLMNLWERKTNVQWSLGSEGTESRAYTSLRNKPKIYDYIYGNKKLLYLSVSQSVYIVILIGMLANIIVGSGNYNRLITLVFIGVYLFHTLLWEVQGRYGYIASICMIILASQGYIKLIDTLKSNTFYINNINIRYIYLPLLLLLFYGFIYDYNKVYTLQNSSEVISGQIFQNHESWVKLSAKKKLTEKIYAPNNFNKIITDINSNTKNSIKVSIKKEGTKNIRQLQPTGENLYSGKKGYYILEVKNILNKPTDVSIIQSNYNFGIFQKHKINELSNSYLGYQLVYESKSLPINKILYIILYLVLISILIGFSWLLKTNNF